MTDIALPDRCPACKSHLVSKTVEHCRTSLGSGFREPFGLTLLGETGEYDCGAKLWVGWSPDGFEIERQVIWPCEPPLLTKWALAS